ncbi:MAG: hypothetical protein J2P28_04695 [Actinobacteria bacterium]|nr:hypothetical protein [Actinomycetota bacterium]
MRSADLGMRAVGWSLDCYPAWWRERYGAEQAELAEDLAAEGRRPWLLAIGLLAGAVRARLTGSGMPPVPALWSSRARVSVVACTIPAALVLPLDFAFVAAVSEQGTGEVPLSGAGTLVWWELTAAFLIWLVCAVQIVAAGGQLAARLLVLASGRRLKAGLFAAAPIIAVILGATMIVVSRSLLPVVGSWEKNLVTGVTHYHYLRRGHPLGAAVLLWAGWVVAVGGWAGGLLALGRAVARSNLPAKALRAAVSNAQTTALTQGCFVLSLIALEVTLALQVPIGPQGSLS